MHYYLDNLYKATKILADKTHKPACNIQSRRQRSVSEPAQEPELYCLQPCSLLSRFSNWTFSSRVHSQLFGHMYSDIVFSQEDEQVLVVLLSLELLKKLCLWTVWGFLCNSWNATKRKHKNAAYFTQRVFGNDEHKIPRK